MKDRIGNGVGWLNNLSNAYNLSRCAQPVGMRTTYPDAHNYRTPAPAPSYARAVCAIRGGTFSSSRARRWRRRAGRASAMGQAHRAYAILPGGRRSPPRRRSTSDTCSGRRGDACAASAHSSEDSSGCASSEAGLVRFLRAHRGLRAAHDIAQDYASDWKPRRVMPRASRSCVGGFQVGAFGAVGTQAAISSSWSSGRRPGRSARRSQGARPHSPPGALLALDGLVCRSCPRPPSCGAWISRRGPSSSIGMRGSGGALRISSDSPGQHPSAAWPLRAVPRRTRRQRAPEPRRQALPRWRAASRYVQDGVHDRGCFMRVDEQRHRQGHVRSPAPRANEDGRHARADWAPTNSSSSVRTARTSARIGSPWPARAYCRSHQRWRQPRGRANTGARRGQQPERSGSETGRVHPSPACRSAISMGHEHARTRVTGVSVVSYWARTHERRPPRTAQDLGEYPRRPRWRGRRSR